MYRHMHVMLYLSCWTGLDGHADISDWLCLASLSSGICSASWPGPECQKKLGMPDIIPLWLSLAYRYCQLLIDYTNEIKKNGQIVNCRIQTTWPSGPRHAFSQNWERFPSSLLQFTPNCIDNSARSVPWHVLAGTHFPWQCSWTPEEWITVCRYIETNVKSRVESLLLAKTVPLLFFVFTFGEQ